jgi:hypothetical protein
MREASKAMSFEYELGKGVSTDAWAGRRGLKGVSGLR